MFRTLACAVALCVYAASALASAADLPPDALVRQGTATLTVEDIDAFAARIPKEQRGGYFDNAKRLESTLRQMLVERQIANDARAMGLDKDSNVQRQMLLADEGVLSKARVEKLKENIKIPDLSDLARERYQANRASFNIPAALDVKHILIMTEKHTDQEAHALADKVHAEAVADPDKFDSLITRYSEDPSAADNGGLMRQAGDKSQYVPEFAEAASQLTQTGQISPVVKTKFGYHILYLIKRAPGRTRSYDEVKDGLLAELQAENVKQQILKYYEHMQNNEVESNAELVNSLRTRYGSANTQSGAEQPADAPVEPEAAPTTNQ